MCLLPNIVSTPEGGGGAPQKGALNQRWGGGAKKNFKDMFNFNLVPRAFGIFLIFFFCKDDDTTYVVFTEKKNQKDTKCPGYEVGVNLLYYKKQSCIIFCTGSVQNKYNQLN